MQHLIQFILTERHFSSGKPLIFYKDRWKCANDSGSKSKARLVIRAGGRFWKCLGGQSSLLNVESVLVMSHTHRQRQATHWKYSTRWKRQTQHTFTWSQSVIILAQWLKNNVLVFFNYPKSTLRLKSVLRHFFFAMGLGYHVACTLYSTVQLKGLN